MKKFLVVVMVLSFVLGIASLASAEFNFKIGVVTGTVSQNEDEYRGAEAMVAKYGADKIKHVTYPDNFMQEQETTISQIVQLASDRQVKAIIICQAVPGSVAAVRKVKEFRNDVIFIFGEPHEEPDLVAREATMSLIPDNLGRGRTIIELAKKMGATHFLHYSFPRHMSYPLLAQRRDIMEKTCKELGIEFVFVTAPDPMGEQGITGAQQFVLEDVPRQVKKYGKNIALFSTNCAMQEPLIVGALKTGAMVPEQCCPSPTHGYPGALGLAITDEMKGNMPAIIKAIDAKIKAQGAAGRFATWPISTNKLMVEAGVEMAIKAVNKQLDLNNIDAVSKEFGKMAGVEVKMNRFGTKGNFYQFVSGSVIFGK